nr:MAG TPA: hypothetical protein [Caudoviricetes sp.]
MIRFNTFINFSLNFLCITKILLINDDIYKQFAY